MPSTDWEEIMAINALMRDQRKLISEDVMKARTMKKVFGNISLGTKVPDAPSTWNHSCKNIPQFHLVFPIPSRLEF